MFWRCGSAEYARLQKRSIGAGFDLGQAIPILRNVDSDSGTGISESLR
jgi:hypothetical protein